MIPPGEISRLAHRLKLGDKTIEKDYVLTWILLAIANSPLRVICPGQVAGLAWDPARHQDVAWAVAPAGGAGEDGLIPVTRRAGEQ